MVSVLAYFAFILKLGAVNKTELKALPKGTTLVRAAEKLHLL